LANIVDLLIIRLKTRRFIKLMIKTGRVLAQTMLSATKMRFLSSQWLTKLGNRVFMTSKTC